MIRLKNISNTSSKYSKGSTIDILVTENPITNSRQWTKKPLKPSGKVDELQARGFKDDEESTQFHIIIKPGEIVEFGEDQEFNEEQAEYVYMNYGSKEGRPDEHPAVRNWLIEVDEDENEVKGEGTLHHKYRENYSIQ